MERPELNINIYFGINKRLSETSDFLSARHNDVMSQSEKLWGFEPLLFGLPTLSTSNLNGDIFDSELVALTLFVNQLLDIFFGR